MCKKNLHYLNYNLFIISVCIICPILKYSISNNNINSAFNSIIGNSRNRYAICDLLSRSSIVYTDYNGGIQV